MSLVSVNKLTGEALDWAVATCEQLPIKFDPMGFKTGSAAGCWVWEDTPNGRMMKIGQNYNPSSNWEQAGPIIEKLRQLSTHLFQVVADGPNIRIQSKPTESEYYSANGETILVAAMRCYVMCMIGAEINLPSALTPDNPTARDNTAPNREYAL